MAAATTAPDTDRVATTTSGKAAGDSPPADDQRLAPVPLDEVPEVAAAMERLGIAPFRPTGLTGHPGRNDNWSGPTADGRQVFVKRLNTASPGAGDRFERMRAFERTRKRAARALSWQAPALLGADRETLVLVFDGLTDAVTGTALADDGRFDPALARRAGQALGELHSLPSDGVPTPATGSVAGAAHDERITGRLAALSLDTYISGSGAELDAWALLQHDRKVREALADLATRSAAAPRTPLHGDLRLDQFLLVDEVLYLTDWEEFRLGDPAADAGGFVGQWLYRAATRMFTELDPETSHLAEDAHQSLVDSGERQLDAVRPRITAFWQGYRTARPEVGAGFGARVMAYAGWHLFDRMLAAALFGHRVSAVQRGTAGVGRNALLNPAGFAESLGLVEDPETRTEPHAPAGTTCTQDAPNNLREER
ncbi:class V lanthionine synthetase subunit LxmK [Streptomyces sp. NPDC048290]|uniref:class V lanthionine synthetase subunit LxmK n=1 Tax=Streptomyces sp. NPDC048290 TaxID=3155811 RepID=UPI0034439F9D